MRRPAVAAAAIVVAALACGALAADPPAVVDLDAPAAKEWFGDDFYGVFCSGARVGWMRRSLTREEYGGIDAVARDVEIHLDVAGDGNGTVTATRTVFAAGGEQMLVAARTVQTTQAKRTSRSITSTGLRFDVVTERRGERTEGAVVACRVTLADELAFERLAAIAAARPEGPAGAALSGASLDFGSLVAGTRSFTVTAASEAGTGAVFDVAVVAGAVRETTKIDARGSIVEGSLSARFSYRREPEEKAKDASSRTSLEELSRIRLDAKLAPVATIRKLVLAWDDPAPRVVAATTRQKLRADGKSLVIEIQRDADGLPVDDDAAQDALADEPGLDLSNPVVGKAAAEILSGTNARGVQAERLLAVTSRIFEYAVVLGTPGAAEMLVRAQTGKPRGDCTEHARLFVALCRAAGIPARTVEGLAWMGDDLGSFGWHQWAEVGILGKWISMDPTSGANPVPATHIVIDGSPEARTLLWGAKFRVVSVERDPPPAK